MCGNKVEIYRSEGKRWIKGIGYEDAITHLKQLKAKGYFDVTYKVNTPISTIGGILFNKDTHCLMGDTGSWKVSHTISSLMDEREIYVWVPCHANELTTGDTAYGTNNQSTVLSCLACVKIVLQGRKTASVKGNGVAIERINHSNYWFKLTRKQ